MKIFNLVFAILFVLFAVLQYNDPDPYIWIPIYIYGALMCWMCFKGKGNRTALYAGITVYLAYAIYLFVADDGVLSWIKDHNAENIAGTMQAQTSLDRRLKGIFRFGYFDGCSGNKCSPYRADLQVCPWKIEWLNLLIRLLINIVIK